MHSGGEASLGIGKAFPVFRPRVADDRYLGTPLTDGMLDKREALRVVKILGVTDHRRDDQALDPIIDLELYMFVESFNVNLTFRGVGRSNCREKFSFGNFARMICLLKVLCYFSRHGYLFSLKETTILLM